MASYFDDGELPIPCPKCSHKTGKKIGWLKTHKQLQCGGCGETINLDSEQFFRELEKAEKALRDFGASISKNIRIDL